MRRALRTLAIASVRRAAQALGAVALSAVLIGGGARGADETPVPDATISIDAYVVGAGLGIITGNGTLTYEGKDYPFTVSGLALGDLGVSNTEARGTVSHLTKLDDFPGTYVGMGAGVTVADGKGTIQLKNQHGVVVELLNEGHGLNVGFGPAGAKFELMRKPKPARMR